MSAAVSLCALALLALDPGSTHTGWARLAPPGARGAQARVRLIEAGHDENEKVYALLMAHVGPVAIEKTFWIPKFMNGQALLDTTRAEGAMRGICHARGMHFVALTSDQWRRSMGLTGVAKGKMDASVARAVRLFVEGLPTGVHDLNNHKRDAIGLGAVASRLLGKEWR